MALEGSVFVGGAVVQWLRDNLNLIRQSSDVEALAATVEDSDGVVFVPAFVGLGAPYWDPYAGGLIIGLRRSTQPGHIARAALESIAFQVADVLEAMGGDAERPVSSLRVDGGAAANDMLMQFQADLLGVPVIRPEIIETTALGAACLAGIATGFWGSPEEIRRGAAGRYDASRPQMGRQDAAEARNRWKRCRRALEALERRRRVDAPQPRCCRACGPVPRPGTLSSLGVAQLAWGSRLTLPAAALP